MARHLRLMRLALRHSVLVAAERKSELALQVLLGLFWTFVALVPLGVLFAHRASVASWSPAESLVVVGIFIAMKGILLGVFQPSMTTAAELVRTGMLESVLLKPLDPQLAISTARIELSRLVDVVVGGAMVATALASLERWPAWSDVAAFAATAVCGTSILYSLCLFVVCLAFHGIEIDQLGYLVISTFDAARWPAAVFEGALAFVFTFVLPLGLMTTFPAAALLGRLSAGEVATSAFAALVFLGLSRASFSRALLAYSRGET